MKYYLAVALVAVTIAVQPSSAAAQYQDPCLYCE